MNPPSTPLSLCLCLLTTLVICSPQVRTVAGVSTFSTATSGAYDAITMLVGAARTTANALTTASATAGIFVPGMKEYFHSTQHCQWWVVVVFGLAKWMCFVLHVSLLFLLRAFFRPLSLSLTHTHTHTLIRCLFS